MGTVAGMVNDLSRQTRTLIFFQMFGYGLMFGAIFSIGSGDRLGLTVTLLAIGLTATIGWAIGSCVFFRRMQTRLESEIVSASTSLVDGTGSGPVVAGRVVRRRVGRRSPGFAASSRLPIGRSSVVFVATALAPGGPRRVAGLAPPAIGLQLHSGVPVVLRLHPTDTDVAVLDDTVTRADLDVVAGDPRWSSDDVPTDRSVAGGSSAILLAAIVGLGAGLLIDMAAIAVLG